jgi:hypothetical protein
MGRRMAGALAIALAAACASLAVEAAAGGTRPLAAQELAQVASSEFSISRETAVLRLDLADGRSIEVAIRAGTAYVDGNRIGAAPRGGEMDRAWRDLLNRGMDLPTAELPALLAGWNAPGSVGEQMAAALRTALQAAPAAAPAAAAAATAIAGDTIDRLLERIEQLERELDRAERRAEQAERRADRAADAAPPRDTGRGPFWHFIQGLEGIFHMMVTYVVLFGIAFIAILAGGRKYIEGVADTARYATGRSLLVGLAGGFLVVPTFVLGIIALTISIVGIPALLVWIPAFPVAVIGALMLGYLAIAHAAGEALAERRFYINDWFERGNSYYFLMTGLGLLLAFFIAAQVMRMAGPWLGFMHGLFIFVGSAITFFAICTGFGAVLLSRGGTRPVRGDSHFIDQEDTLRERANV